MAAEDRKHTTEELEKEKKELLVKIKELELPKSFGNDVDSFDEETDEAEELSNRLAMAQAFRDRINEIDKELRELNRDA